MPPTRMTTEVSTIYQPQHQIPQDDQQLASATAIDTPIPSDPTAATNHGSAQRRRRSPPNPDSRGFQIRHGAFKLNQLRLPTTASRFVIMQVILSCVCAVLGILAVAFHCWMAYMCIPVIVGALELFVGIMGYTAIKRPHKRILIKMYFAGCLLGSLAGLALVIFSIIGAISEEDYECTLLPNVIARCNVVRGARLTIELTTVVIGTGVIVVTQVMFMFMCYGCCARSQNEDQRGRSRASNTNPSEDVPANLELPSYDDHHHYPASPFHEGSFFVNSVSSGGFEPPSYTNIGLVTDEMPGGITPLAAALALAGLPLEPPPPYTLFAPNLQSTPVAGRSFMGSSANTTPSTGAGGVPSVQNAGVNGSNVPGNLSLAPNQTLEPPQGVVMRDGESRGSRRSVQGYSTPASGVYQHQTGLRDRTIHQSLRLNSEQSGEWISRSAHQRQIGEERSRQSQSTVGSRDDPNILPPELYRDQIRRSGHRYSLSDPTLLSRNARNRQRSGPPPDTTQSQAQDRSTDFAINVDDGSVEESEVVVSYQTETESYRTPSPTDHTQDSPRRRQALPPPYEGRHNVVRTHSSTTSRTTDVTYLERNAEQSCDVTARAQENFARTEPTQCREGVQADIHEARTLPSNWRPQLEEDSIYASIPSLQSSPSREEQSSSPERPRQFESDASRYSTSEADRGDHVVEDYRDNMYRLNLNDQERREHWRGVQDRTGRGRAGSRSWDEGASQEQGLPDVVGCRDNARDQSTQDGGEDVESERGTLVGRQPPPYGGRRVPAYAPPPYKSRNRSLPNYARRQNLTSPPPPYQGNSQSPQRNVNREEPRRTGAGPRNFETGESSDRPIAGCAVRQITELSGRVGYEEAPSSNEIGVGNERRENRDSRGRVGPGESEGYDRRVSTFRDHPQPIVSHSLPRLSLSSSLSISPPSSTSSRRHQSPVSPNYHSSSPSSFSQYPTSPSSSSASSVTLTSSRQPSLPSSTSSPSRSSNAVSPRRARADLLARISGPASRQPPPPASSSSSTSSPYSRSFQADREVNRDALQRDQYARRPRPVAPIRSSPSTLVSSPTPRPINSSHSSRPPSHNQVSPSPIPSSVPLHPLSLPGATTTQPRSFQQSSNISNSSKPEMVSRSRTDGKPAAEIHPFRTVRSTPVKAQRAYVATKALANALQKGQLNDLLEEYEETII